MSATNSFIGSSGQQRANSDRLILLGREHADRAPEIETRWRPLAKYALGVVFLTFVVFGGWSAIARLDSAAIASGVVANSGNIKTIQHLEGGIVKEIFVKNGDHVEAGDLLIKLDTTQSKANVNLFKRQLAAGQAQVARLTAEQALSDDFKYPSSVLELEGDPVVANTMQDERTSFKVGRSMLEQQEKILAIQSDQIGEEMAVLETGRASAQSELQIVTSRVNDLHKLSKQGLVQRGEVLQMERDFLALTSKVSSASSDIVRARQRIAENQLKVVQLQKEYQEAAATELAPLNKELRELQRQIIVAEDMLRRVEIVAPVAGVVQEMSVFTVGGIIKPGEAILNIAPTGDNFVVNAQVTPLDADTVEVGMDAEIQFPAFAAYNLLPIQGKVIGRSGDRIVDPVTKTAYFAVEIEVERDNVPPKLRDRLGAGLPASVVIPTGERTALAYLTDPLLSRLTLSMRER